METCPIVKTTTNTICNWQTILLVGCVVILLLVVCYYLYKFMKLSDTRLRVLEQAVGTLDERTKRNNFQPPQPQPQPFFTQQELLPKPMAVAPQQPPQPSVVVVDTKTLDKELSEELKELSEGRVDNNAVVDNTPPPTTTATTTTSNEPK